MVRPLLFPALESEVGWWITCQNCERDDWKNTSLNDEQRIRLANCEASVEYFEKQSLQIKNKKFLYRKHFFKDFRSHQCLSEVLNEPEDDILKKFTDLEKSYHTLLRNLPHISSGDPKLWSTLRDERRIAACDVRQLLKPLLHVRSNIHKGRKDVYHKSVLNEELVMATMIGEDIRTWKKQDPSY
ncbi:hypothetical protein ISN44_As07g009440 [Arabidopsis suecica]|uniref:Uncharacterized protein n=1 Tax=Arabidopsis suecica TaxID=45249 RepID=A0A8T2BMJ0_ARASU|nr:hypothetical protein ISN44_As07g009440 [Arabidopsis suecica]